MGVYWYGQDGNIWLKGNDGVKNVGALGDIRGTDFANAIFANNQRNIMTQGLKKGVFEMCQDKYQTK